MPVGHLLLEILIKMCFSSYRKKSGLFAMTAQVPEALDGHFRPVEMGPYDPELLKLL